METSNLRVRILLTAITRDQEDIDLTVGAYNSYHKCPTSFLKDITVDTRLHPKSEAVGGKWNDWIQFYRRTQDYDYILICANDTLAYPQAFEYLIRVMQNNKHIGILHPVLERDKKTFDKNYNEPIEYTDDIYFDPNETAQMVLRKGVIETVGDFDLLLPHERGEQDYFVRAKKMGIELGTSPMKLFYHPPHSQDDPNRQGLKVADKNFLDKHGADWFTAIEGGGYQYPYNDPTKDWTCTLKGSR